MSLFDSVSSASPSHGSDALTESSICVLIVDDDPFFCEILRDLLQEMTNYILDTAMDGEQALQKWNAGVAHGRPYDLIFVDLGLPKMNGETLIHKIREKDQEVVLIVISSEGTLDIAYKLLQRYKIADYLQKPLRHPDLFLFAVHRALEHQQNLRDLHRSVTMCQKTEQELHLFSKAMGQTSDRVMITNKDGVIEYVNSAFEHITGYSQKEAVGKTPVLLKSGKHPTEFYESLWETILSGSMFRSEITNRHRDGSLYQEEESIEPIRNEEGSITHFVSIGRDLRELQTLNQQLLKNNQQLKEMQAGLVQSSKMVALGIMSTGIAHEINQPLNIIRMYAERCLVKQEDKEWMDKGLNHIIQQVDRAAEITNHMRVYGRTTDSESEENFTEVNLVDLARKAINVFVGIELAQNQVELLQEYPENSLHILCHAIEIEQVLVNLILNAKDAVLDSKQKQVTVRILETKEWGIVEVEDTGSGISKEIQEHIFEPFFTTKNVGEGTGLGLFISYAIIQKHHGKLELNNTQNGCLFRIKLPKPK